MDISGAQLNSAAITAYNAQLQGNAQQNKQAETPVEPKPSIPEVSLSSEARAKQDGQPAVAQATNALGKPVAQTSTGTFAERQAVHSYFNVSNL